MPFSYFLGDSEICLSVNRIELTIKYLKTVIQKFNLMRKQKSGPQKMAKIWMKRHKKWQKVGKINPEFYRN